MVYVVYLYRIWNGSLDDVIEKTGNGEGANAAGGGGDGGEVGAFMNFGGEVAF